MKAYIEGTKYRSKFRNYEVFALQYKNNHQEVVDFLNFHGLDVSLDPSDKVIYFSNPNHVYKTGIHPNEWVLVDDLGAYVFINSIVDRGYEPVE